MQKRKLQIFLSSTYEDLKDYRLAAMEAILGAGHIPAAMEQFAPGDETAWEKITAWIDESDAFILILGGRYGSIEPVSGKSYVQLEYEYAVAKKKPFFALVVTKEHHEQRVKEFGLQVDEREKQQMYTEFRGLVTQRLCGFWNDKKDIKAAIFQKLPEWAQKSDLMGWVRANEATNPEVMNELARLSQENRELRAQIKDAPEQFAGLEYEELIDLLKESKVSGNDVQTLGLGLKDQVLDGDSLLHCFELGFDGMARGFMFARGVPNRILAEFMGFGLLTVHPQANLDHYSITETGRRLRNQLLRKKRSGPD